MWGADGVRLPPDQLDDHASFTAFGGVPVQFDLDSGAQCKE